MVETSQSPNGEGLVGQAGSGDISPKAWDSFNMMSCCPAEEKAGPNIPRSHLRSFLERDGIEMCDGKPNSIQQGGNLETRSSRLGSPSLGELWRSSSGCLAEPLGCGPLSSGSTGS